MMRWLKNTSIKQRLTSLIMSVSFISVILTTLVISAIGMRHMQENILNELSVSASIVGASNKAALSFDTYKKPGDSLGIFSEYKSIIRACIYDHKTLAGDIIDKPVASYPVDNQDEVRKCPSNLLPRQIIGKDRIQLLKPITGSDGDLIGYIYLESTLDQIDDYIKKQSTIALMVALAALIVSYLLAINLQNAISHPILNLADTARRISKYKDYSIRATPLGDAEKEDKNELVILTTAFNNMLAEIGARNQQLKQQNVELEKAKDIAESASRAKSQFLANISHELRTPLNAIIGFSSILMNQLFGALGDQKYLEYARDINESGAHLLDIINDILDLSKAEAGKLHLEYDEVNVGKAVQKCIAILSERAAKGKVTITTDIPKMLPPLTVDRLRFTQILINIISNAVKFTQGGGSVHVAVSVPTAAGESLPENARFVITIEDNGIGMSKEDIAKAFQSFGQVDSGLNRKYEGTGLGLPLTKKLVDLHHATINIESELGKGTRVTLVFPALPPEGVEYDAV